jgi:hypothetical protein
MAGLFFASGQPVFVLVGGGRIFFVPNGKKIAVERRRRRANGTCPPFSEQEGQFLFNVFAPLSAGAISFSFLLSMCGASSSRTNHAPISFLIPEKTICFNFSKTQAPFFNTILPLPPQRKPLSLPIIHPLKKI